MATGPKPATTPEEALDRVVTREEPFLTKIWGPTVGAIMGFTAVLYSQWATRRPLMSGLQRYAVATVGLGFLGKYIDDYRRDYLAERDAVFRHYIQLHPEDFPPFPRKKFSEVLDSWTPIR